MRSWLPAVLTVSLGSEPGEGIACVSTQEWRQGNMRKTSCGLNAESVDAILISAIDISMVEALALHWPEQPFLESEARTDACLVMACLLGPHASTRHAMKLRKAQVQWVRKLRQH